MSDCHRRTRKNEKELMGRGVRVRRRAMAWLKDFHAKREGDLRRCNACDSLPRTLQQVRSQQQTPAAVAVTSAAKGKRALQCAWSTSMGEEGVQGL